VFPGNAYQAKWDRSDYCVGSRSDAVFNALWLNPEKRYHLDRVVRKARDSE